MKLQGKQQDKICWKPNRPKERMNVVLVMYIAWKTPEEQNRHCTGFLMRAEIEVDHALHGKIQSGELLA